MTTVGSTGLGRSGGLHLGLPYRRCTQTLGASSATFPGTSAGPGTCTHGMQVCSGLTQRATALAHRVQTSQSHPWLVYSTTGGCQSMPTCSGSCAVACWGLGASGETGLFAPLPPTWEALAWPSIGHCDQPGNEPAGDTSLPVSPSLGHSSFQNKCIIFFF